MSDFIQTYTGRRFHFMNPQPDEVHILDIAHALSNECRFGGHCSQHYSVAQHSVHVAELVPLELGLVGLLHDAAEAYCKDIPRPIKRSNAEHRKLESRILDLLSQVFMVDLQNKPPDVHVADMRMLATEQRDLMRGGAWPGFDWEPLPQKIQPWSPERARREFLGLFGFYVGAEIVEMDADMAWGVG